MSPLSSNVAVTNIMQLAHTRPQQESARFAALVEGCTAASYVCYALSDQILVSSVVPSTYMGEIVRRWAARGDKNAQGTANDVVVLKEAEASAAFGVASIDGRRVSTIISSLGLVFMQPIMYRLAKERTPCVMHVAAGPTLAPVMSIFSDHSEVMAVRDTGFALLSSHSVQECHDLAIIAHAASAAASLPTLHFFDGLRTSHESAQVELLAWSELSKVASEYKCCTEKSSKSEDPKPPLVSIPEIFEQTMEQLAPLLGQRYRLFEYVGVPDADMVIVIMGSGATVAEQTIRTLADTPYKVGVLKVHLYRPWSAKHFIEALPSTVSRLALLECASGEKAMAGALFYDVVSSFEHSAAAHFTHTPIVAGCSVGLGSSELYPGMIKAVFDNLAEQERSSPKASQLLSSAAPIMAVDRLKTGSMPLGTVQLISWGYGGDGASDSAKRLHEIFASSQHSNCVQGYVLYDSDDQGLVTCTHTRAVMGSTSATQREGPSFPSSLIEAADMTVCYSEALCTHYNIASRAASRGIVLINTPKTFEALDATLPTHFKAQASKQALRIYTIDAADVALRCGLHTRMDVVMQVAALRLLLTDRPHDAALADAQEAALSELREVLNTRYLGAPVTKQLQAHELSCTHHPIPSAWADLPALQQSVVHSQPLRAPVSSASSSSSSSASSGAGRNNRQPQDFPCSLAHLLVPVSVETPYNQVLSELFGSEIEIINGQGHLFLDNAEYGFGQAVATKQARERLFKAAQELLTSSTGAKLPSEGRDATAEELKEPLRGLVSRWVAAADHPEESQQVAQEVGAYFDKHGTHACPPALRAMSATPTLLPKKSLWIVGGDGWSYDIGYRGLAPVLSSTEDVNILLLETGVPGDSASGASSKKDIGLYAMHYSNSAFVASVALNAGKESQLEQALRQAKDFRGPSLVIAYCAEGATAPGSINSRGNAALDTGAWILYRYDPSMEEGGTLWLDCAHSREALSEYLHPNAHTRIVVNQNALPQHVADLRSGVPSLEDHTREKQAAASKAAMVSQKALTDSFAKLCESITGAAPPSADDASGVQQEPLSIIFGSDGGRAEAVARRFATASKSRKIPVDIVCANDFDVAKLKTTSRLLAVVSTAGQGEFPGNSAEFWKRLGALADGSLASLQFAVFAMGDRHYWTGPGEEVYFCKPGKDLDMKLGKLTGGDGCRILPLGIGDDQDTDGYETGLEKFESEFWRKVAADAIVVPDQGVQPAARNCEEIKIASRFLRGTLREGLLDTTTGALPVDDTQLTKFHGIYQQDDRDLRPARAAAGLEKAFSFMIRVGPPGGVVTPSQWLGLDSIADDYCNGTLKITTRQAVQFHGIVKNVLKKTMQAINKTLLTSLAACGDVNRCVMCNPNPFQSSVHMETQRLAVDLTKALMPKTTAYHEIWLDKKPVVGFKDVEPVYGPTYLPRKFKIAIAVPPSNDVDVFAHCLGYIAIVQNNTVVGYNVTVGGGMGMSHNKKETYPRLADVLGFITTREQAVEVAIAVVEVQRDYGNRQNRKNARLKYTIEQCGGLEWFRGQVEAKLSFKLGKHKPYEFTHNTDRWGWTKGVGGLWHYCLFVPSGRVYDRGDWQQKTALQKIAQVHDGEFRMTPNQHLIICNVRPGDRARIETILTAHNCQNGNLSGARLASMACVALPTCSQAFAEAERFLPELITSIDGLLENHGLFDEKIVIRMTGCPNGCARPSLGEIAFVGKAPGMYNMYLGAKHTGERLNKLYRENVDKDAILKILDPMFGRFSVERQHGEHFGDFVVRVGIIKGQVSVPLALNRPPGITFHEHTVVW